MKDNVMENTPKTADQEFIELTRYALQTLYDRYRFNVEIKQDQNAIGPLTQIRITVYGCSAEPLIDLVGQHMFLQDFKDGFGKMITEVQERIKTIEVNEQARRRMERRE